MSAVNFALGALAGAAATAVAADAYPSMMPTLGLNRPQIELKYFDFAGAAEKVRFTLLMGGVPFKDTRVSFKEWAELKPTTKYGQLPEMYLNGETKPYAQSGAMLRFAGAITGLVPKDPIKALSVDEAIGLDEDLRREMRPSIVISYDQTIKPKEKARKIKELREKLVADQIPKFLSHFEQMLGNSDYLCGSSPTIADAQFLVTCRWLGSGVLDHIPADIMTKYPKITAFRERMETRPEIAAYLNKPK
jgi:glutathione S-transferase|tara:strand:+ start:8316 stop:9059 length:744 start_codon:yes stop_codon:yes gene_type:complete